MPTDDTLPAERLTDPSAPPESWDRYEIGERLGEGGMGVVYKARDRRLDRAVAIKFIRGGNPTLTMRLLREARAQARIDHPGVCGVHEVGEVNGRAYIALQFVDGETLGRAAATMSLDEKIAVMRDVCLAMHEAHRLGIIHRDLKPSNVLVERGEDGRAQPIVMDFGLAREATLEVGLTESGALLGTPAYMSPEQARGDVRAVDRRSDVYSLGATLYELLTNHLPFTSESLALALDMVIHQDPTAPRSIVPTLPVDLETITLKSMSKDPARRYTSARELAEDLTRYLDGEPILGRRPTLRQRMRTSFQRHRALYVLSVSSVVALLAVGGVALNSYLGTRAERARSVDRTELAQRLGRDAKDIELLLHTTYQLPLHDTRRERDLVRARMKAIAATTHDLGPLGDAVIHDAVGRGHLALHEWAAALDELELAAKAGLDTPELHAARGRALGELYHRAYEEARRSGDKTWLAGRERELEQQYLAPALVELERARGAGEASALLDVLVPLYRHDYATAKARAVAISKDSPWVFEAKKLAADAVYAAAIVDMDRGSYDAARPQLDEASALYAQAAEIARSDATVYEAAAAARQQRAEIDVRQSHPAKEALDDAVATIDRALTADPGAATAYTTKGYILLLRSNARVDGAADRRPLLERAAAAAQRAVTLDARDAGAWDALGNAHVYRGLYELAHGGEGETWWRISLGEFARALAIRPNDPWTNNDVGIAHRWLGTTLAKKGGDPMPEYASALAGYRRATEVDPEYVNGWANQADLSATIADLQLERGADPRAAIEEAVKIGERGMAIDSSRDAFLENMATAEVTRAAFLIDAGEDPMAALVAARGYLDRADKLRPANMPTYFYRARASRLEVRWRLGLRQDASAEIAAARTSIAEAIRLSPALGDVFVERAELELIAGELETARTAADKAITLDPESAAAQVVAADVQLAFAQRTHDPEAVERGLAHADRAVAIDRSSRRAAILRAAIAALR